MTVAFYRRMAHDRGMCNPKIQRGYRDPQISLEPITTLRALNPNDDSSVSLFWTDWCDKTGPNPLERSEQLLLFMPSKTARVAEPGAGSNLFVVQTYGSF